MKYITEKFVFCIVRNDIPIAVSDNEKFVKEFISNNKRLDKLCDIKSKYTYHSIPMCISE